jgi:hypothetical protein
MAPVKPSKLLLAAMLLALSTGLAHADAGSIGTELPFIEGPPDLVQSLRDSYAVARPKKAKKKSIAKAKPRLAQVKKGAKESKKD